MRLPPLSGDMSVTEPLLPWRKFFGVWLMMKKVLMVCVASLLVSACAGIAAKKQPDPVVITNASALAGKQEVVLGDFRVSFVTYDNTTAKSESPMFSADRGYARSSLRATLVGVSDDIMQSLTDAAYSDFVARLAASGYSVADSAVLASNAEWQKMKRLGSPQKDAAVLGGLIGRSQESATFAPSGKDMVAYNGNDKMPFHAYLAADQLGRPILSVHYKVHFVYFGSETDYTSNRGIEYKGAEYSAQVSAGQGVQVVPGSSVEWMVGAAGTFANPNATVAIGAPVLIPGAYGRSADATTNTQKAVNMFSSAVGMVTGGSSSAKDIEITADPQAYADNAKKALLEANQRLSAALAGAR